MKLLADDSFQLASSGRTISGKRFGVLGLMRVDDDGHPAPSGLNLVLTEGYETKVDFGGLPLSVKERREIARYMLIHWRKWGGL